MKLRISLTLLVVVLLLSCKKDKTEDTPLSSYYYEATIDGENYKQVVTETNSYIPSSATNGSGENFSFIAGINPLFDLQPGETALQVEKGLITNYYSTPPSDATFKNFFKAGDYSFSIDAQAGIEILWIDKNGVKWSTSKGSANQSGSSFKIVNVVDEEPDQTYYIRVTMEFNCKLYNDNGQVKQLSNGKMVGIFGKI